MRKGGDRFGGATPDAARGMAAYEVLRELGRGSIGVTYRGRRRRDDHIVVLKQVSTRHFDTEKRKTQALMEAKIMKQMNSAHVVEYYDAFVERNPRQDQEFLYIVIQFCTEGDLKTMLANNSSRELPERTIWRLFLRVALGLEYLHSRRVLHRDLTSENIFLTGDDAVRIGDLGLAKILTKAAMGNAAMRSAFHCGTPRHASPEEVTGSSHCNDKSNVWALGVILYELCSDRHRGPFDSATRLPTLLDKIVSEEPPALPVRSTSALRDVTSLLLDKNMLQRPAVGELLSMQVVKTFADEYGVTELHQQERNRDQHRQSVPSSMPASVEADQRLERDDPEGHDPMYAPGEKPDGFFSKVGSTLGICGVEAADAPRFHRLHFCEICVAQHADHSDFAMNRRRHHCRNCGRSICRQHAVAERALRHIGYATPVTVCEICNLLPSEEPSSSSRTAVVAADGRAHAGDSRGVQLIKPLTPESEDHV